MTPFEELMASGQVPDDMNERQHTANRSSLWEGPSGKGWNGGVTFSMLSRFFVCRERFRIHYVEGLRTVDKWNHRMQYGNLWHAAEEALADGKDWLGALLLYSQGLCKRYRLQQEQVLHWTEVCRVQFPLYVEHWKRHLDVQARTPLMAEQVFDVPYALPSGRVVRLRGKWDSVDLVAGSGVWLQENKSKGDVDSLRVGQQLKFDLQTMIYLVALHEKPSCDLPRTGFFRSSDGEEHRIVGVRYNVIRRPLSGGKGTIVQHKSTKSNPRGESKEEFYARLGNVIAENADQFFMRWNVEVSSADVMKFRKTCLDPILEQMCDWWAWIKVDPSNPWRKGNVIHSVFPFGVYNPLLEGQSTDLDFHLEDGSEVGLHRAEKLFEELT